MTKASRFAAQAAIQILTLAGFWIASVATVRTDEMLVGLGAVALSVAFCLFTIRTLPLEFRPKVSEILEVFRLPWYVAIDVYQITFVLAMDLLGRRKWGRFRSVPWPHVKNNGRDTARRVLAIGYTTVTPNAVVVGVDCGRGQFLYHQLRPDHLPSFTRRLGAEDPTAKEPQ
jgi:hypothetical protein